MLYLIITVILHIHYHSHIEIALFIYHHHYRHQACLFTLVLLIKIDVLLFANITYHYQQMMTQLYLCNQASSILMCTY